MDIRHLRYFLAITESQSLSMAAQKLGVAQPSLSQHLRKIEDELGVTLVERSPRGVVVTQDGLVLAEHARSICAKFDACVADMRDMSGDIRGTVSFGIPPSAAMAMSVPLAETVRLELPHVRLRAIEAMSSYIKKWIEDSTVEMAIVYDLESSEHLRATHLLDEELHFISAPDNWPFKSTIGSLVEFRDIEKVELILPSPSNGLRRTIDRYQAAHGVNLNVVIDMDAMTQIKELVSRGSVHTILAPIAIRDMIGRGDLISAPIINPVLTRPIHLVNHPARVLSRAAKAVELITLKVVHELVERGIWHAKLPHC